MMKNFSKIQNNNFENIYLSSIDIPKIQDEIEKNSSYRTELSDWENSYADSRKFIKRKTDFICGRLAAKKAVKNYLENNVTSQKPGGPPAAAPGGGVFCRGSAPAPRLCPHENENFQNNFELNEIELKDIEIRRKESGEPQVYIKNKKINLSVTISHSNDFAVSVVSPKEIYKGLGVDIEKIEDRDFSFQEIAFNQNEIDDLKCSNASDCENNSYSSEDITRYWTIKESVLKSLGIGLNVDLKDIEITKTINNKTVVKINSDVMERYEKLKGSKINVESYKIKDYMLSISFLQ